MNSIWEGRGEDFSPKDGSQRTDVLIIGGGIAGILCLDKLKRLGVDCLLIEKGKILEGVTRGTTAKITLSHGLIYHRLLKEMGYERAYLYLRAQRGALERYASLAKDIDCDYEVKDAFVYSRCDRRKVEEEIRALDELGLRAEYSEAHILPFEVAGALRVEKQAQFNPIKFLYKIAEGLPIQEKTAALNIKSGRVTTERGEIEYKRLIVATHFPIMNRHGGYSLKMYQHRSYVMALEGAERVCGMYVDEAKEGMSFRDYGDLLLLGGGGHRTGKRGGGFAELEAFRRAHYPNSRIIKRWATQDCITLDGAPYIGRYSLTTPNIYVATGFNKWGMSTAMVAANMLADMVLGIKSDYEAVFSPSRSMLRRELIENAVESAKNLITPFGPRCTHLGCRLIYNREEHSWDCPCHGSRYDKDGRVIDNPATRDKGVIK